MRAEVVAIGDELTSGQRLDTNSQWLSRQLQDLGLDLNFHTTVGDQVAHMVAAIRAASSRSDVVVSTGGLGPTADDVTRDALAEASGSPLVQDPDMLRWIEQLYERRGRTMPPRNVVQATRPRDSDWIPNPHGTAPGIDQKIQNCRWFALPGVPAEMREMWEQTVAPAILELSGSGRQMVHHETVRCFGVGESDLEQMLPGLIQRGREPAVGITVSRATISLRVTAKGSDLSSCRAAMQPTLDIIHDCLGDLVFGYGSDELQHVVLKMLARQRKTLTTVEVATEGYLSHWLATCTAPGNVKPFRGGLVLPPLEPTGSTATPEKQLRTRLQSAVLPAADFALAIGPIVPATEAESGGRRIAMGVRSDQTGWRFWTKLFEGHPDVVRQRAAKQALDHLRRQLAGHAVP